MAVEKIYINEFLERAKLYPVIDVRSPSEYNHAHFPGAFSLPVFTDEERAAVGTSYKQENREKAIRIGLDFFAPKMNRMLEEVEQRIIPLFKGRNRNTAGDLPEGGVVDPKTILVYCWRGGMRSAAVSWLLDLYGYKIFTLSGGYKKFRNRVLQTFSTHLPLRIIGGYTGSGKTEVLKELEKRGEVIVDLEEIARHKGSAFGNIGMPEQPKQEMFENLLGVSLMEAGHRVQNRPVPESSCIWLEDESQRIGLVNLPNELWKMMRQSPVFFLDVPFEERLRHITEEYGNMDKGRMADAIGRISQRLGGLETKNALQHLEGGDIPACFRILLTYYDRWYLRGLHNRENLNTLLNTVKCKTVNPLNAKLLIQQPEYHEKP